MQGIKSVKLYFWGKKQDKVERNRKKMKETREMGKKQEKCERNREEEVIGKGRDRKEKSQGRKELPR